MSPYHDYADALDRDAQALDAACDRERAKPMHLWIHIRRVAVRACKTLLDAADQGAPLLGPLLPGKLIRVDRVKDDAVLWYWKLFATTWLRSARPHAFRANAGAFDFLPVRTDEQCRVLCKDGSPLRVIAVSRDGQETDVTDLMSEERAALFPLASGARFETRGDVAHMTDDYDDDDWLSRLRLVAADWADACRAGAELLRACGVPASDGGQADNETDISPRKSHNVPGNRDVLRLAKKIKKERPRGVSMIDSARDFCEGNEQRAKSLLRQLRRYPHLLH